MRRLIAVNCKHSSAVAPWILLIELQTWQVTVGYSRRVLVACGGSLATGRGWEKTVIRKRSGKKRKRRKRSRGDRSGDLRSTTPSTEAERTVPWLRNCRQRWVVSAKRCDSLRRNIALFTRFWKLG
ncbi:hypothetical protein BDV41DRAFT_539067 [Aspergillus transmontanensis]|uniref:Uncharacterized protein n=1 Tax=Aspergillus transmontanensis TaxID=1034304 RepID=A0A5N6VZC4_9EURO|nr:hypothetical protein BDV41DRAFT_539067 [Aspergillus transmontanensis]